METYIQIKNFEGCYEVSNLGNVRSIERPVYNSDGSWKRTAKSRIMKPYKMPNGYLHVSLRKGTIYKSLRIHRLVAEHFLNNPDNLPEVNHKDCDKENNRLTNLEWTTRKDNVLHAIAHKKFPMLGETHKNAKLTAIQVIQIREKYSKGSKLVRLAEEYSVSDGSIWEIVNRLTWKHI